jgi:3-oxoacyl-[acyl-carrier protein] reductase
MTAEFAFNRRRERAPSGASMGTKGRLVRQGIDLHGKVALVSGAGSGLGYEIARQLLDSGAEVVLHYRSSKQGVKELSARFGPDKSLAVQADFEDPACIGPLFEKARSWRNRIDILVNNAAWVEAVESFEDIDEPMLERSLRINFTASFMLSKLVAEEMKRAGTGRIVSISSIGVKFGGSPQTAHYMVSKAALEAGTLALAKAFASYGILVNIVRAGVTHTKVHERLGRDLATRRALIPMKRLGEPDEVAAVVLFMVSPLNTYMTGAIIPVAGGE